MKCPFCAAAELIHDTRDVPYTYKGESTIIPAVTGDFCPACGEAVFSESARISTVMLEFIRQVDCCNISSGKNIWSDFYQSKDKATDDFMTKRKDVISDEGRFNFEDWTQPGNKSK